MTTGGRAGPGRETPPRKASRATKTHQWQEGGNFIPGTINHFGGSSTTEYGPLLKTVYPMPGFKTRALFNNFNSRDMNNPCPVDPSFRPGF